MSAVFTFFLKDRIIRFFIYIKWWIININHSPLDKQEKMYITHEDKNNNCHAASLKILPYSFVIYFLSTRLLYELVIKVKNMCHSSNLLFIFTSSCY